MLTNGKTEEFFKSLVSYVSGKVVVKPSYFKNIVEVSVEDSGVGMTDDQIKKIFTVENSTVKGTDEVSGTGLGLLLCKEFIEKNVGKIIVESVLGAGSVFTVTIPRSKLVLEHRLQQIPVS